MIDRLIGAALVFLLLLTFGAQLVLYVDRLDSRVTKLEHAQDMSKLRHRVTQLEHACGPVDTGGGVTQCANPNVLQAPPR